LRHAVAPRPDAVIVALLWLGVGREPLEIMYTPLAVIVAIVGFDLPLMVLTLQSVIEGIDPAVAKRIPA
jgi:putative spermidine/putrescine transport system permease protein